MGRYENFHTTQSHLILILIFLKFKLLKINIYNLLINKYIKIYNLF